MFYSLHKAGLFSVVIYEISDLCSTKTELHIRKKLVKSAWFDICQWKCSIYVLRSNLENLRSYCVTWHAVWDNIQLCLTVSFGKLSEREIRIRLFWKAPSRVRVHDLEWSSSLLEFQQILQQIRFHHLRLPKESRVAMDPFVVKKRAWIHVTLNPILAFGED